MRNNNFWEQTQEDNYFNFPTNIGLNLTNINQSRNVGLCNQSKPFATFMQRYFSICRKGKVYNSKVYFYVQKYM